MADGGWRGLTMPYRSRRRGCSCIQEEIQHLLSRGVIRIQGGCEMCCSPKGRGGVFVECWRAEASCGLWSGFSRVARHANSDDKASILMDALDGREGTEYSSGVRCPVSIAAWSTVTVLYR